MIPPIDSLSLSETFDDSEETETKSLEDFWIFFSFSMIFLVIILMNYVTYLSSIAVKISDLPPGKSLDMIESKDSSSLNIFVKMENDQVLFSFDDGKAVSKNELIKELEDQIPRLDEMSEIYVYAPGNVYYQHIFDVSFWISQLGGKNINLVYASESDSK